VSLRLRWFSISKSEDAAVRDDFPSTTIELGAGWECSEPRAAIRPHLKNPVVHSAAKRLHEDKRHASVVSELAVSETNPANLPSL
jgi:hypothetical protein